MLDDFREQARSSYLEEEDAFEMEEERVTKRLFLGLTPIQRLMLALMLLVLTCLLGSFLLLVTGKVAILL